MFQFYKLQGVQKLANNFILGTELLKCLIEVRLSMERLLYKDIAEDIVLLQCNNHER